MTTEGPSTYHFGDGHRVDVTVTVSAGSDGAYVVFIDTNFEPDATDGSPGLRVMLNDGDIFIGKEYSND